jgi:hypothetical protein
MKKIISFLKNIFTKPQIPSGLFIIGIVLAAGVGYTAVALKYLHESSVQIISLHHVAGENIETDGVTLTMESFRVDTKGVPGLAPSSGNEFIMPMVDITNHTNADLEMIPILYFSIKDADGNVYHPTAVPLMTDQLTGPILPGEKVREEIGFEIPLNSKDPALYFERGTPNHPVVAIDLVNPK